MCVADVASRRQCPPPPAETTLQQFATPSLVLGGKEARPQKPALVQFAMLGDHAKHRRRIANERLAAYLVDANCSYEHLLSKLSDNYVLFSDNEKLDTRTVLVATEATAAAGSSSSGITAAAAGHTRPGSCQHRCARSSSTKPLKDICSSSSSSQLFRLNNG